MQDHMLTGHRYTAKLEVCSSSSSSMYLTFDLLAKGLRSCPNTDIEEILHTEALPPLPRKMCRRQWLQQQ